MTEVNVTVFNDLPKECWRHPKGSVLVVAQCVIDGKQYESPLFVNIDDYITDTQKRNASEVVTKDMERWLDSND